MSKEKVQLQADNSKLNDKVKRLEKLAQILEDENSHLQAKHVNVIKKEEINPVKRIAFKDNDVFENDIFKRSRVHLDLER